MAGVSPVVGTVLLAVIVVGVVAVIFTVAVPQFRTLQTQAEAEAALTAVRRLDARMEDLALNPPARSDVVDLNLPAGGMRLVDDRVRVAVSFSSSADQRYNFTLGSLADGDHVYNVTTRGVTGIVPVADDLVVRHTLWRDGLPESADDVTIAIPALGTAAPVPVTNATGSVNLSALAGAVLEVSLEAADGTVVGGAWIASSDGVRFEGDLYTGPHAYEAVLGGVIVEEPGRPVRLVAFDAVQVAQAASPHPVVSIRLVRVEAGPHAALTVGRGPLRVPMEARAPFAMVGDEVVGNVTVQPVLAHADLFDAGLVGAGLQANATHDRVFWPGAARLALSDHLVVLPQGLVSR